MTFGECVKKCRNESGITQRELASRMGVSTAMVAQYENKSSIPKFVTIQRFANALQVDPAVLIDDKSWMGSEDSELLRFMHDYLSKNGVDMGIPDDTIDSILVFIEKKLRRAVAVDEYKRQRAHEAEIYDTVGLLGRSMDKNSFTPSEETKETKIISKLMNLLNEQGQEVAVERVEELTEIPKYQKNPPSADSEDGNSK